MTVPNHSNAATSTASGADTTERTSRLPFVVDLSQIDAGDLARSGGKAINLGELIRAGFPVPPGFVITIAAYDQVVVANDLGALIDRVAMPGGATAIRDAFVAAQIPPEVEQTILNAYRRLGGGAVAVRSSATAEDLPEAAFAGQQDTFLGILDEGALFGAVRRCWASLWSDRAIAYRERHGLAGVPVKLAVIVQRLVAADAAGVLFTANPITGARDETIVDASTGLGEAVVSGLVTPDHVVLRKRRWGWQIVDRRLGRREIIVRPLAGGGTEQIAAAPGAEPALPDAVLRRLARLGAAIAQHFGRPQDIEWAWADEQLFVLQSRPITALPEERPRRGRFQPASVGPIEYFQVRPYPLDNTTWMPAMLAALSRMLPLGNAIPSADSLWVEEDGVIVSFAGWPSFRVTPDLLLAPFRLLPLAIRYDPARWRDDPLLQEFQAVSRDMAARDLPSLPWSELFSMAREALALPFAVMEIRRRYLPRTMFALGGLRLMLGFLGLENRFGTLLSGIDNKTLEANRALESLAAEIRAAPALADLFVTQDVDTLGVTLEETPAGRMFLEKLRAFLDVYGHRETVSPVLVSQPTWSDAPEVVLGILKGLARAEPAPRDGQPGWQVARDEALAHPLLQFPPLRAAFLTLLMEARRFPVLREDTHFYATQPMQLLRRSLVEMGRRLTGAGILETPQDVFHLRFDELERAENAWPPSLGLATELKDTACRRAERRAALADTPLLDSPMLAPPATVGDALLAGTPGSPGLAEGPVRVVREASGFGSLQPGEILVAPYTNPSWTPLFGRAAAVVVDTGSSVSHAAIVAREYGIPAVMGTGDGTRRLRDGQLVRVDGTHGLVFPVPADVAIGSA